MNGIFNDLIDCKRILREIAILRNIDSPYVVKLLDIIEPQDSANYNSISLVMECADSDLKKLIKSSLFLEEVHIKVLVYNILNGLKYLHSAQVLHRDIKPANILINEDCSIKICDFGLARSVVGINAG